MKLNAKNKRIEFMIEQCFDMDYDPELGESTSINRGGEEKLHYYVDSVIKRDFKPKFPFLFNYGAGLDNKDDDTLFSKHYDYLICEPEDIMKDGFEYILIDNIKIKWMRIEPHCTKRNKRVFIHGKGSLFEVHYREKVLGGKQDYTKNFAALRGDKIPLIFCDKQYLKECSDDHYQTIMACSIKEEIYKDGVFHIKITKKETGKGIRLALNSWEVIDLLKFRDKPITKTGRKKPILHWVAAHIKGDNKTKIAKYNRGLQEFEYDNYTIEVKEPNIKANGFGVIKNETT